MSPKAQEQASTPVPAAVVAAAHAIAGTGDEGGAVIAGKAASTTEKQSSTADNAIKIEVDSQSAAIAQPKPTVTAATFIRRDAITSDNSGGTVDTATNVEDAPSSAALSQLEPTPIQTEAATTGPTAHPGIITISGPVEPLTSNSRLVNGTQGLTQPVPTTNVTPTPHVPQQPTPIASNPSLAPRPLPQAPPRTQLPTLAARPPPGPIASQAPLSLPQAAKPRKSRITSKVRPGVYEVQGAPVLVHPHNPAPLHPVHGSLPANPGPFRHHVPGQRPLAPAPSLRAAPPVAIPRLTNVYQPRYPKPTRPNSSTRTAASTPGAPPPHAVLGPTSGLVRVVNEGPPKGPRPVYNLTPAQTIALQISGDALVIPSSRSGGVSTRRIVTMKERKRVLRWLEETRIYVPPKDSRQARVRGGQKWVWDQELELWWRPPTTDEAADKFRVKNATLSRWWRKREDILKAKGSERTFKRKNLKVKKSRKKAVLVRTVRRTGEHVLIDNGDNDGPSDLVEDFYSLPLAPRKKRPSQVQNDNAAGNGEDVDMISDGDEMNEDGDGDGEEDNDDEMADEDEDDGDDDDEDAELAAFEAALRQANEEDDDE